MHYEEWYLWGNVLASDGFDAQFYSYTVTYSEQWHICGIGMEPTSHPHPLGIYEVDRKLLVRLRYMIPDLTLETLMGLYDS